MPKRSKSRQPSKFKTESNSFRTGNMLSHPSGDKIFKEQSKILLEKQKKEKDLWMLNTRPEFMNGQKQEEGEENECDTDIEMDHNSPKRRISRKVIQVKNKKIIVRIPYDRERDSESDVTSGEEEETINHYKKPEGRNNFYMPEPIQGFNKTEERNNFNKPEGRVINIKKEEPIKKSFNPGKETEIAPIRKVEEKKKPMNRMETSQEVLKRWEEEYYAATERKMARFHDDNDNHNENNHEW